MRARIIPTTGIAAKSLKTAKKDQPRLSHIMHKYELDGDYIVVDPASCSVHIADKQAFELLDRVKPSIFERYEGIEGGCYAELYRLWKDGMLFSDDDCRHLAETSVDAPLKALCLQVSFDCNLNCGYCFAHDNVAEKLTMSEETAISAIDFLVLHSKEREELEVDFFGGEPLMAWETVTAAVDYAKANEQKWGKHFRFTVTTNGLLLDDEKISYINANMHNCVMSLDGRKEVNDRIRPALNGKGSFDLIIDKFKKLVNARESNEFPFRDWYVRGTFTAFNLDFAEDVIELARLGFKNISLEPVTVPDSNAENAPYAIKREHLPRIYEQYEKLYKLIKSGELDINFFHFNVALNGGPCVIRRLRGCGCGNEYLAVTPSGDIFPCHRFSGISGQYMGNIADGNINPAIKTNFTKTHIYSKSDCPECWARFYCSGGCNASSYENFGDCNKTDSESTECLMMKKRLECAIALNALKSSV